MIKVLLLPIDNGRLRPCKKWRTCCNFLNMSGVEDGGPTE